MRESNVNKPWLAVVSIMAALSTMLYYPVIHLLNVIGVSIPTVTYTYYNYAVFGCSVICSAFYLFKVNKGKVSTKASRGLLLFVLITLIYLVFGVFVPEDNTYFTYFILWALPALCVGTFLPSLENHMLPKILEILSFMMCLAAFLASRQYLSLGIAHLNTLNFGGTNYQGLSYTAAFCIGLELFFVFIAPQECHFLFFAGTFGKICEIGVSIGAVFAVLVSGGRGGLLVVVLDIIIFLFLLRKKNELSSRSTHIVRIFIVLLVLVFVFIFIRNFVDNGNALVSDSMSRLLSFLNFTSGDLTNPTGGRMGIFGRSSVYAESIEVIKNSPVIGSGIFNMKATNGMPYPHNIILETWIHAGFLYMVLWVGIFISLWRKGATIATKSIGHSWILFILSYATIFLSVSGTYLWCSELWFLIGVLFSFYSDAVAEVNKEQYE